MKIEDVRFKAKIKGIKTLGKVFTIQYYTNCNEIAELDIILPFTKEIQKELGKEDYFHRIDYDEDYISVNIGFKDIEALLPYTGFKDKNGESIYEGDILESEDIRYLIVFINGAFALEYIENIKLGDTIHKWEKRYPNPKWIEIAYELIGNKFENPELLKKES